MDPQIEVATKPALIKKTSSELNKSFSSSEKSNDWYILIIMPC
jgi:hypothetical protein